MLRLQREGRGAVLPLQGPSTAPFSRRFDGNSVAGRGLKHLVLSRSKEASVLGECRGMVQNSDLAAALLWPFVRDGEGVIGAPGFVEASTVPSWGEIGNGMLRQLRVSLVKGCIVKYLGTAAVLCPCICRGLVGGGNTESCGRQWYEWGLVDGEA